jgi:amino acid adenylation domain-containing protein/non-ribosomal peptide synthase protein (TIGR01720 family)
VTLLDILSRRARTDRGRTAYTFLPASGDRCEVTYGELHNRALRIAAVLREIGAERVVLTFPPGLRFIEALCGCWYAGAAAIPVSPAAKGRRSTRLSALLADAQTTVVLTTAALSRTLEGVVSDIGLEPRVLIIEDLEQREPATPRNVHADELAVLQYTSGSTATPKGVMVSHANLTAQLAELDADLAHDADSVLVSWLPHFHDMGLVYGILQPLFGGFRGVLLPPVAFLQEPARWLEAITEFRGTHTAAPNFAYDLCTESISEERRARLNLESWRVALVGAEPVRARTLERFAKQFAPQGLRRTTLRPGYGLAEATLKVAIAPPLPEFSTCIRAAGGPPSVGHGYPAAGATIVIADPDRGSCVADGEIGEIWYAGPTVAQGYWNRPRETEEVFSAFLANGEGPFLRTGDLGYIDRGQLHIAGRIKDLIIIRGRNVYPQDVELAVEQSAPELRKGRGAAFGLDFDGQEQLGIAYEVERTQRGADLDETVRAIRRCLADQFELQPQLVVLLNPGGVPMTSSGKIRRSACREAVLNQMLPELRRWTPAEGRQASRARGPVTDWRAWVLEQVAQFKLLDPQRIPTHEAFAFLGFDSKDAVAFATQLSKRLAKDLPATLLYDHPTVDALAGALERLDAMAPNGGVAVSPRGAGATPVAAEAIAIVGMACRFPKAADLTSFWRMLCDGVDAVSETPNDRWRNDEFFHPDPQRPGRTNTRWGGFLEDVDRFAASFFGISAREASRMDPQQRLLLETTWTALEDAGFPIGPLAGAPVGVFVGISGSDYGSLQMRRSELLDAHVTSGSALSIAANRISYYFDWRGPSMAVDTACSSSLVAVHTACESLQRGESSVAVAAGANLILAPHVAIDLAKAGLMSPQGRCRAFDAGADGYVRSEGVGVVVLKPLARALADGDRLYCIIRGSAVNQDGRSNGLMAPNRNAQEELLRKAFQNAGLAAADVEYVEAHGTGTLLGDPIEAAALDAVLRVGRPGDRKCWIGSVKTNIGHTEAAAGIAGLIKTALMLHHRRIVPHLHFRSPNPHIPFATNCLRVPTRLVDWAADRARFAGVSSFGFGGTNAHVVVEEAPYQPDAQSCGPYVLPISAKTPEGLRNLARSYAELLETQEGQAALGNICYTAAARRTHHGYRTALVAGAASDFVSALGQLAEGRLSVVESSSVLPPAVFVYSGHGTQWAGMGRGLLAIAAFRETIERCDAISRELASWSVLELLETSDASGWEGEERVQVAIFSLQAGLTALFRSWGVQPGAVIGHSMGEIAAAWAAGAIELKEAVRLVLARSSAVSKIAGGMAALGLSEAETTKLIQQAAPGLCIAATNAPDSTIVSGPEQQIQAVLAACLKRGVFAKRVRIDYASHSGLLDPIESEFIANVGKVSWKPPEIRVFSTVSPDSESSRFDVSHWWGNLRQPICFRQAMDAAIEAGFTTFLEISGHPVLELPISECAKAKGRDVFVTSTLERWRDATGCALESLGRLWERGHQVSWRDVFPNGMRVVSLPAYPFERQRYWMPEPGPSVDSPAKDAAPLSAPKPGAVSVREELRSILARFLETRPENIDGRARFTEMGADSIVMMNAIRAIRDRFGVTVTVRQLFETHPNLDALASHIAETAPALLIEETPVVAAGEPAEPSAKGNPPAADVATRIMEQQLALVRSVISEQLAALRGVSSGPAAHTEKEPAAAPLEPRQATIDKPSSEVFVPYRAIEPEIARELTPLQASHRDDLAWRLTGKTAGSKALTQKFRQVLADNRASAGFRYSIKEMLYPIHAARSSGSRIVDVDGNQYLDITMGFGVNLFGHNPRFIMEALRAQFDLGIQLGPQADRAGEVAALIAELCKVERVAFTNSGTEAVMTAIRLARASTGRSKVALFAGSYHGSFDGVLGVQADGNGAAAPMAPGVAAGSIRDVLVLNYDDPDCISHLERHAKDLAAVLVEPVQSRRPELQPLDLLRSLRQFTANNGAALIFDEVITGFRIAPGGAQEWFGVEADLCTFGKIVGGGMPIGVVAGLRKYLDGIDGGHWSYSDSSFPAEPTTFFAGTFCKHPLAIAAAHAVLTHLKAAGPSLQADLTYRTAQVAARLNSTFQAEDAPLRVVHFGSLFRFAFRGNLDLFFYHLLEKGIYVWEGRNCFLSTAHTDDDLDALCRACELTVREMQTGGFLPGSERRDPQRASAPITTAEKQLLVLAESDTAASLAYNVSAAIELSGSLARPRLQHALHEVALRHESLRSWFDTEAGDRRWSWRVAPFEYRDLTHSPDSCGLWTEEANRPFDLARGPLFRASLFRVGIERHVLVLTGHHTVVDGGSIGLILQETSEIYRGAKLAELPPQYREHANKQDERMRSELARSDEAFWTAQLSAPLPMLDLPAGIARSAAPSYDGAQVSIILSAAETETLRAFSTRQNATLFMTLLAAWGAVLHRRSGQSDIIVGVPHAGRWWEGSERVVGFLANMTPVRMRMRDGRQSVADYLQAIRATTVETFDRADYPYSELIYRIPLPPRAAGRSPLFDVTFNLDRVSDHKSLFALESRILPVPAAGAKYDLALNVTDTGGRIEAALVYRTGLFSSAAAQQLVDAWHLALQHFAADPHCSIALLHAEPEELRDAVLHEWSGARAVYPSSPEPSVESIFENNAACCPDAIALLEGAAHVSYGALNARANQVAHFLKTRDVGPEDRVAICLPRGALWAVCMWGVLKTGGAFVPLDPSHPAARLAHIARDARVRLVLTSSAVLPALPAEQFEVILLDDEWPRTGSQFDSIPPSGAVSQNAAYLMYTSGSTGSPKGVVVERRQLAGYVRAIVERLGFAEGWRYAAVQSFAADASITVAVASLCSLGTMHLIDDETARDSSALANILSHCPVDVFKTTPSHLHALGVESIPMPFERIILGGEPLSNVLCAELSTRTKAQIWNHYGPTECTVAATAFRADDPELESLSAPLGMPLPNSRVYVLDTDGCPCPVGAAGEIYLGGHGVSRGYWNRPAFTAENFVPDEFATEPGGRLYRTGDRGRWREDGTLQFVGRADRQVKIRGYRVELGEVEAALLRCDGVREVAVALRGDPQRLVAYVALDPGSTFDPSFLRVRVGLAVPDYMAPSAYIRIDRVPLSPNGKTDYNALPEPELDGKADSQRPIGGNPIEEILIGIWREVLGNQDIGPNTNFFDVGGHSLLALQVISRVRRTLGTELTVRVIFERPTLCLLAAHVSDSLWTSAPVRSRILRRPRSEEWLPLSSAQQRLWFLDRMNPGSALYNMPHALRLRGAVDAPKLRRALGEIVRRHEILRTRIVEVDGTPYQQISEFRPFVLRAVDLRGLVDPETACSAIERCEASVPIPLGGGKLLRALLIILTHDEFELILNLHHIACDGWSVARLLSELSRFYCSGTLPELEVQYADYASWQREQLNEETVRTHSEYWKNQLAGSPATELPADARRPPVAAYRGENLFFEFGEALSANLPALCRCEGVTLFMALAAGWLFLLSRYTRQYDVAAGCDVVNRNRPELEDLIGLFVNQLVLRVRIAKDDTFRDLLGKVRQVALDGYAHQEMPFEAVVDEVAQERDLSRSPLFQTKVVVHDFALHEFTLPGLTVTHRPLANGTAKFDLTLFVRRTASALTGEIEFATDLYEAETIRQLVRCYRALLGEAVAYPEHRLRDLCLETPAEQNSLIARGRAKTSAAGNIPVHEQFSAAARQCPDAVALVEGAVQLSYREVDLRASQLARGLRAMGLGPESRVALCMDRSLEMVIAVLGILKAGAAYVPIDPAYPAERIEHIRADSRASLLLTRDEYESIRSRIWAECPAIPVRPGNAAYIIYTSGSTGKPKGVVVTHENVSRLFETTRDYFGFGRDDSWTLFHSIAFDFSVWELWGPLISGGRLLIVPFIDSRSPERMLELLERHRITVLNQTPSAFQQLATADAGIEAPRGLALRFVIFGGEALDPAVIRPWLRRCGDGRPRFVNMYGITETTVHVTARDVRPGDRDVCGSLVGAPLRDLSLYILDEEMRPVPVGVPGEIWVGGAGVARGYWQRASLTAERFRPDPFALEGGGRLYRSGDLGRWRSDGDIEYLGRSDEQVKIRGFRIELGEIEAALAACEGVLQAAVAVHEREGTRQLAGYIVTGPQKPVNWTEVRAHLRRQLPQYMIPSAFAALPQLPLTPNGKLDRQALAWPVEQSGESADQREEAPRSEVEEKLARIWGDVLGHPRVASGQNFFELGGDSILSIRIVSRAREAGVPLTVQDLFQHQTIAQLAEVLTRREAPIRRESAPQSLLSGPVVWTPIQRWFFAQNRFRPSHYNQAVMLKPRKELDADRLVKSFTTVVRHHDMLRLRVRSGYGEIDPEVTATVPCLDLQGVAEQTVSAVMTSVQGSLDWENGPITRLVRLRLDRGERLLWVAHHLAVDAISWRILVTDLDRAYEGRDLAAKTNSYQQWAARLEAYLATDELSGEIAYWSRIAEQQCGGLPTADTPDAIATAGTLETELDESETTRLLTALAQNYSCGPEPALLLALAESVGEQTGAGRVIVDVESHGRENQFRDLDLSRTVGWFTSLYPVIVELRGRTLAERLRYTVEALGRVPNGGIGYGLLCYGPIDDARAAGHLQPIRSTILFNYLGRLDSTIPAGAAFEYVDAPVGGTQPGFEVRHHAWEITASIWRGRLRIELRYPAQYGLEAQKLAARVQTVLASLGTARPALLDVEEEELASALASVSVDF